MIKFRQLLLLILFICLFPLIAKSQKDSVDYFSLSLEELMNIKVRSSSYFDIKSSKAPGYFYVINFDKDVSRMPINNFSEVGNYIVPGVSIGTQATIGKEWGVRGMKIVVNTKTLAMLDGQQLNQHHNLGYWIGLQMPFMGDLKSSEISLGPNSLMHGSGAINGYYNFIPKNGNTDEGLMLNLEGGIREKMGLAEIGYGWDYGDGRNRNLFVYAGIYNSDGFMPDTATNAKKSVKKTLCTPQPCYKLAAYWNHDNFNLNLNYWDYHYNYKNGTVPTYQRALMARPKYVINLTEKDVIDVIGSAQIFDIGANTKSSDYYGGTETNLELKTVFKTTRFDKHFISFGVSGAIRDMRQGESLLGSQITKVETKPEDLPYLMSTPNWEAGAAKWTERSIFAEDIFQITEQATLSFGGRYDQIRFSDASRNMKNFSPRVAFSYEINSTSVAKLCYQEGFRTPDAVHYWKSDMRLAILNTANGTDYKLNLQPEKLKSLELNLHKALFKQKLSVDVNLYYNIYEKAIDFIQIAKTYVNKNKTIDSIQIMYPNYYYPDAVIEKTMRWIYENRKKETTFSYYANAAGDIKTYGTEVILRYMPITRTDLRLVYAYSQYANQDYYKRNYPMHQVKFYANQMVLDDKLDLGLTFLYEPASELDGTRIDPIYANPRTILNLSVKYFLNDNISIKLSGMNLLGEKTPSMSDVPASPYLQCLGEEERYFYLTLQFKL